MPAFTGLPSGTVSSSTIMAGDEGGSTVKFTAQDVADLASGGVAAVTVKRDLSHLGSTNLIINALHAYGDSVTANTTPGYITPFSTRSGIALTNHAISGDQAGDQSEVAHGITVTSAMLNTLSIGLNDARQYGSTTAKAAAFQSAHAELVAWLAIPDANKVLARSVLITYTGTWTNDSNNGNIAKKSSTAGDTAGFSFFGTTLYLASRFVNSNSNSSFTVTIDGGTPATYSCDPGATITTQNAQTYSSQLIRIADLAMGHHSVVVTVVGGGGTVYLEWVVGLNGSTAPTWPRVLVATLYELNGTGYATSPANASNAVIQQYNDLIITNNEMLGNDGLLVGTVDIARFWDVNSFLNVDGIHPSNTSGFTYFGDSFTAAFANIGVRVEVDVTPNSTWAAYAAGFEPRARLINGIVTLHGNMKRNASASAVMGNLPVGLRPLGQDRYPATIFDAGITHTPAGMKVGTNGDITIMVSPLSTVTDNVSLDGISYPVAKNWAS